ncbi:phosphoenolpyruvate carboxykinase (GTP) [Lysinibacter cavernae]|uniref:Phosphoenolpyruvate carboxykinase [GTP] n=1 Tax=Lysinibacter cavernae TaxID=1640652 RepID=A0A7X5QYB8_9MICO|nr:phosphoenolpyruvate carboxykinase (GTP) [Lysinibacter cavernae]NIH52151.1 phosphoenolpyruvate carboxykinase (GTP) [Lysinibacter cavernae]
MTVIDTPDVSLDSNVGSHGEPTTNNPEVLAWVAEVAELTEPDYIHWCDGSQEEWQALTEELVATGTLIPLNKDLRPGSFLARSHPGDVARVEDRTFICTENEAEAGPTNNWRAPADMHATLKPLFRGSMRGRTMYVVPFSMGPVGGPITQVGIQLTDSPYAVLNMRIMTRMGQAAMDYITPGIEWVRTVHSVGMPLVNDNGDVIDDVEWPCNDEKYICQFPDTLEVWSFGSGYGGNALLSKKCFALRIASVMARNNGWLAEHMLLLKLTNPVGKTFHIAAAFPSACGKTNLAMLRPTIPGWKVETIGDDIAWLRPGPDGRLRAINPEAGFFGVAPGTGYSTNPVAMDSIWGNTIFTNVALTDDGDVWWEGMTDTPPSHLIDWQGNDWTPDADRPAAHPNSRFTVPITQCPTVANEWFESDGVPLDAILFGGRRATNIPLVSESLSWNHGVFIGASVSSEKTAAQEGTVGELRRDPFAMLPFCGYNMADYWSHWLSIGETLGEHAPKVFQVNWFRKGDDGRFLWPGFGENSRVLDWIIRRVDGEVTGRELAVGTVPADGELNLDGIHVPAADLEELFEVDPELWAAECDLTEEYFAQFGANMPEALNEQLAALRTRLTAV